jgi:hypothetical protein
MTFIPDGDRDPLMSLTDDPQRLQQTLTDLFAVAAAPSSKCGTCQMLSNSVKVVAYLQHVLREGER